MLGSSLTNPICLPTSTSSQQILQILFSTFPSPVPSVFTTVFLFQFLARASQDYLQPPNMTLSSDFSLHQSDKPVRLIFPKPTLIKASTLPKNSSDFPVPIHQIPYPFGFSKKQPLLAPLCKRFLHAEGFACTVSSKPPMAL